MNRPDDMPLDADKIEELRTWLLAEKDALNVSWEKLGHLVGRAGGTLQPFVKGTYKGVVEEVARDVYRYRQMVETQRERLVPTDPGFIEMPTANRLLGLFTIAHRGRVTMAGMGSGMCKTMAAEHYQSCNSNVWIATLSPSKKKMSQVLWEVSKAVGQPLKYSYSSGASRGICEAVKGRRGLIIVDEANHAEVEAIEELRSIYDETGVGLCLLGNEELLRNMRSGLRKDQFARLNSRVAARHEQDVPLAADVQAYCEGWKITDGAMQAFFRDVALTPGSGGLRECAMILESAMDLAMMDERAITLADLRDALSTRATRHVRA